MEPIRVTAVDDPPIVRQGIQNVLAVQADILVVGEAEHAAELFRQLESVVPDVLLLDIRMPNQGGIEILYQLKRGRPPG